MLTESLHTEVIRLIESAQEHVVLVSPYLALWERLATELARAHTRSGALALVSRGGEDQARQEEEIAPLRYLFAYVGFAERLHAKVYLNDSEALVGSLNLHRSSAMDSIELGVLLDRRQEPGGYADVSRFCEGLIAKAEQDRHRRGGHAPRLTVPAAPITPTPASLAGYCIRCRGRIELSAARPLCRDCYAAWAVYRNESYEENHCHRCGRSTTTSMIRPLCRPCWRDAA